MLSLLDFLQAVSLFLGFKTPQLGINLLQFFTSTRGYIASNLVFSPHLILFKSCNLCILTLFLLNSLESSSELGCLVICEDHDAKSKVKFSPQHLSIISHQNDPAKILLSRNSKLSPWKDHQTWTLT